MAGSRARRWLRVLLRGWCGRLTDGFAARRELFERLEEDDGGRRDLRPSRFLSTSEYESRSDDVLDLLDGGAGVASTSRLTRVRADTGGTDMCGGGVRGGGLPAGLGGVSPEPLFARGGEYCSCIVRTTCVGVGFVEMLG